MYAVSALLASQQQAGEPGNKTGLGLGLSVTHSTEDDFYEVGICIHRLGEIPSPPNRPRLATSFIGLPEKAVGWGSGSSSICDATGIAPVHGLVRPTARKVCFRRVKIPWSFGARNEGQLAFGRGASLATIGHSTGVAMDETAPVLGISGSDARLAEPTNKHQTYRLWYFPGLSSCRRSRSTNAGRFTSDDASPNTGICL